MSWLWSGSIYSSSHSSPNSYSEQVCDPSNPPPCCLSHSTDQSSTSHAWPGLLVPFPDRSYTIHIHGQGCLSPRQIGTFHFPGHSAYTPPLRATTQLYGNDTADALSHNGSENSIGGYHSWDTVILPRVNLGRFFGRASLWQFIASSG